MGVGFDPVSSVVLVPVDPLLVQVDLLLVRVDLLLVWVDLLLVRVDLLLVQVDLLLMDHLEGSEVTDSWAGCRLRCRSGCRWYQCWRGRLRCRSRCRWYRRWGRWYRCWRGRLRCRSRCRWYRCWGRWYRCWRGRLRCPRVSCTPPSTSSSTSSSCIFVLMRRRSVSCSAPGWAPLFWSPAWIRERRLIGITLTALAAGAVWVKLSWSQSGNFSSRLFSTWHDSM